MLVLLSLLLSPCIYADLLFEDDNCTVSLNNTFGKCTNIHKCDFAKTLLLKDKKPDLCGFSGLTPIVCCPVDENHTISTKGALSRKTCCPVDGNHTIATKGALSREMCDKYNDLRNRGVEIAFGVTAADKEYPHMAAIGFVNNETKKILWLCGGSLISHYFVLSAAHCAYSYDYGPAKFIRLGSVDLNNTTDDADSRNRRISHTYVHPHYNASSHYHDIALFKLEKVTIFTTYISPACLHTRRNVSGDMLEVAGWGKVGFFEESSPHLMKAKLKIVDHDTCAKRYVGVSSRRLKSGILDEYQICAGDEQGRDTCPGDSGGPLHYKKNGSDWILDHFFVVGITSFGKGCGVANSVGVYTRVGSYVDWIESIVWPEEDPDF